ncbi:MAG: hypothetical protein CMM07_06730 [Rhodopirellula sp.]|nr:hypothetical protein [Rhodopirellula sp.]
MWLRLHGEAQTRNEKRRLSEFVLSNSLGAGGEFASDLRQRLDIQSVVVMVGAQKLTAGLLASSHHQKNHQTADEQVASLIRDFGCGLVFTLLSFWIVSAISLPSAATFDS